MSSSKYQFNQLLAEQDNFLDTMLSFIPNIHDNKHSTAAEWVLHALLEKYEEQFVLIAIKKGVAILEHKMMDAPTVSAMLEDCNKFNQCKKIISSFITILWSAYSYIREVMNAVLQ